MNEDEWRFITIYIYKSSEGDYFASSNRHINNPGGSIVASYEVPFIDNSIAGVSQQSTKDNGNDN